MIFYISIYLLVVEHLERMNCFRAIFGSLVLADSILFPIESFSNPIFRLDLPRYCKMIASDIGNIG
ncbi:unnamed protein product [Camellia sinensis]